eukprot:gene40554-53630_t
MLAMLAIATLYMGLYPKPFTDNSAMIDKLSWIAVYPEIILAVMACVILLVDLGVKSPMRTVTYVLTLITLAVVAALEAAYATGGQTFYGFGKMVVVDPMGSWLKCFSCIALMVSLVYGRPYAFDRDMLRGGEFFTLSLFALLGMFVMISGHNFLVIYLGLELLTLSSYALVALRRDDVQATEAAMKYFVLGALASGFLLYGLSMVYGATGSLDLAEVMKSIAGGQATLKGSAQVLTLGLVFVVAGLAFKLGAVPFHMWTPDVYEGAPTPVTAFFAGAPKVAAMAMLIRVVTVSFGPITHDWQQIVVFLSIASMVLAAFAAIGQNSLKRLLAYSSIGHVGFALVGLAAGTAVGVEGVAVYMAIYLVMTIGMFAAILSLRTSNGYVENISQMSGLAQKRPFVAAIVAIIMFSFI